MDLPGIVARSKQGQVSSSELREIAKVLEDGARPDERYDLIYVLGRSFAFEYEELIARYLDSPRDPWLARCALQVLCQMWDRQEAYAAWLRRFVSGVEWDDDGMVRQMALSSAGTYLRTHPDLELWHLVLARAAESNSDELERGVATEAIAEALGASTVEVVKSRAAARDATTWQRAVVEDGRRRLAELEAT